MGGIKLGRIFGFPIEIRGSFLILLAVVFLSGLVSGNPLLSVALLVVAFLSVLAHELGHALVARRLGVSIVGIDLHVFGGAAKMANLPRNARDEIWISAAGPAVSFALALIAALLYLVTGFWGVYYLLLTNLLLGVFNLLPALPMDGGRILRAALSLRMGFVPATELSVKIARWVAGGLALFGFLFGNFWLVALAVMLWIMSSQELAVAKVMGYGGSPWRGGGFHQSSSAGNAFGEIWQMLRGAGPGAGARRSSRGHANAELLDREGRPIGQWDQTQGQGEMFTVETVVVAGTQLWIVRDGAGKILLRSKHPVG